MPSKSLRASAVIIVLGLVTTGCAWEARISQPSTGFPYGATGRPAVSADGRYVAYEAYTDNAAPGVIQGIYRRDTVTNTTVLVSRATDGTLPDDASGEPAISADGRYVAFSSDATTLVPNDTNDVTDVFVRDMVANTTTRVSVSPTIGEVTDPSYSPSISADGSKIAFISESDELSPADDNGDSDAYVADRTTGEMILASIAAGVQPDFGISDVTISGDGKYVAFTTDTDLFAADQNFDDDVYIRNIVTSSTSRATGATNGDPEAGGGWSPSLSYDGRYVAFVSYSDYDGATDPYPGTDIYVRDRVGGGVTRASVGPTGGFLDGAANDPVLSSNGRRVAFTSTGNATGTDTNGAVADAFVRDLDLARNYLLSTEMMLAQSAQPSTGPVISGDGHYVAFLTAGALFGPNDTNGLTDVYLRAVDVPQLGSISPTSAARGSTVTLTVNGKSFLPGVLAVQVPGVYQPTSITRVSETKVTVTLQIAANAPTGPVSVYVQNPGTGPGIAAGAIGECAKCLTVS